MFVSHPINHSILTAALSNAPEENHEKRIALAVTEECLPCFLDLACEWRVRKSELGKK
jgi:hypothetical protein